MRGGFRFGGGESAVSDGRHREARDASREGTDDARAKRSRKKIAIAPTEFQTRGPRSPTVDECRRLPMRLAFDGLLVESIESISPSPSERWSRRDRRGAGAVVAGDAGVGRAHVPLAPEPEHLRWICRLHVLVQCVGVELREHERALQAGVDDVRHREVDEAIARSELQRRARVELRQRVTRARPARQHHRLQAVERDGIRLGARRDSRRVGHRFVRVRRRRGGFRNLRVRIRGRGNRRDRDARTGRAGVLRGGRERMTRVRRGQKRRKGRSGETIRAVSRSRAPPCRDIRTHLNRARANIPFDASVRPGERAARVDAAVASGRARPRCRYPSCVRGARARARRGPPAGARGSPQRELGVRSHSVDIRASGGLSVAKKQKKGENNSTTCQLAKPVAHRGIINQSRRALAVGSDSDARLPRKF